MTDKVTSISQTKNKGGRPTRYTPELIEATHKYIATDWQAAGDAIPSVAGLSLAVGVPQSTLYDLMHRYSEYRALIDQLLAVQQQRLLTNGLNGTFNPTIAKLILGRHGYSDKVDVQQDITSGGESLAPATFKGVSKDSGGRTVDVTPDSLNEATQKALELQPQRIKTKPQNKTNGIKALDNWRDV